MRRKAKGQADDRDDTKSGAKSRFHTDSVMPAGASVAGSGRTHDHQIGTEKGSSRIVVRRATARQSRVFPHGLFLPGAKGISKELRCPPLEFFPKTWRPVPDGTAAVITEDLFYAPAFGGILFVFDTVNPLVATNAIEGRFFFRSQCFHRELNLRSPRSSRFNSPSLRPKRNN